MNVCLPVISKCACVRARTVPELRECPGSDVMSSNRIPFHVYHWYYTCTNLQKHVFKSPFHIYHWYNTCTNLQKHVFKSNSIPYLLLVLYMYKFAKTCLQIEFHSIFIIGIMHVQICKNMYSNRIPFHIYHWYNTCT